MNSGLELRQYQELILTQARLSNTIAYLPTGTGKTLIACHLIKDRLENLRKQREKARKESCEDLPIIIFIAPTKALLHQQIEYIKSHAYPVQAHEFNGDSLYEGRKVDSWGRQEWMRNITSFEVLGMTPKLCADCIAKNLFPVKIINLVILDECHHSVKNHPMSELCDLLNDSEDEKPLIFGMTASPIDSKTKNLSEAIYNLENKLAGQFFYPTPEFLELLKNYWKTPRMFLIESPSLTPGEGTLFEVIKTKLDMAGKLEDVYLQEKEFNRNYKIFLRTADEEDKEEGEETPLFDGILASVSTQSLNPKLIRLNVFDGLKQVKEIVHQTTEITKSCGLYCGLYAFSYRLQSIGEEITKKFEYRNQMVKEALEKMFGEFTDLNNANISNGDSSPEIFEKEPRLFSFESSSKRVISIDTLPSKASELIEYLGGNEILLQQLLHQTKLTFLCFHQLILGFSEFIFGPNHLINLKDIVQGILTAPSKSFKAQELELVSIYSLFLQSSEGKEDLILKLIEKDFKIIFILLSEKLLKFISLQSLGNRFMENFQETVSSNHLVHSTSSSSPFLLFTPKVYCLIDLIKSSITFSPNGLTQTELRDYDIIESRLEKHIKNMKLVKQDLSSQTLLQIMRECLATPPSTQSNTKEITNADGATIIFCDMKLTAITLNYLLQSIMAEISTQLSLPPQDIPIRSGVLTGSNSMLQQRSTLQNLKLNKINLLFATNVAQEGLDVKQCNLIINFDPPKTLIGFIQRRGRARSSQSLYIQLVPSLDESDQDNGKEAKDSFEFMKQEEETNEILQIFLTLSQDLGFLSLEKNISSKNNDCYKIPSTGASVNSIQARSLLNDYCSYMMSNDPNAKELTESYLLVDHLRYVIDKLTDEDSRNHCGYRCLLFLPDYFHQYKFIDDDCPKYFSADAANKRKAEGKVALKAIEFLHKKNQLNDHLQIIPLPVKESSNQGKRSHRNSDNEGEQSSLIEVKIQNLPSSLLDVHQKGDNSCLSLYVYGLRFLNMQDLKEAPNSRYYTHKYLSQLDALQKIGILSSSQLSPAVLNGIYELFLSPAFSSCLSSSMEISENKDHGGEVEEIDDVTKYSQLRFQLTFLGVKSASPQEYSLLGVFNKMIDDLQVPQNQVSAHLADSKISSHFPFQTQLTIRKIIPDVLNSSSDCGLFILPLPDQITSKIGKTNESDFSLINALSEDYIKDCIKEISLLLTNLAILRKNNYEEHAYNYNFSVISDLSEMKIDPEIRNKETIFNNTVFTSNGKNLFCMESHQEFNQYKLSDSMTGKTNDKTFAEHFIKRNPLITNYLTAFMSQNPDYTLQRAYALTGDISHTDLLKVRDTSGSLISLRNEIDVFPDFCCPLGSLFYYHLIFLLPSFVHRIHSILIAEELFSTSLALPTFLRIKPSFSLELADFLVAITPRRNLQSFNSERLEFLGDVFLKFSASNFCFFFNFQDDEAGLSNNRGRYLTNKSLISKAEELNLVRYLRVLKVHHHLPLEVLELLDADDQTVAVQSDDSKDHINKRAKLSHDLLLSCGNWCRSLRNRNIFLTRRQITNKMKQLASAEMEKSEKISQNERLNDEEMVIIRDDDCSNNVENKNLTVAKLGAKAVADMMEALLGACVIKDGYEDVGYYLLHHLQILSPTDLSLHNLQSLVKNYVKVLEENQGSYLTAELTTVQLQEKIRYKFQYPCLLSLCTKPSSSIGRLHYQRLEYLGDGVLDYLVARYLYHCSSDWKEGTLSKLKSLMTENFTLQHMNTHLSLHRFLQNMSLGFFVAELQLEGQINDDEDDDNDNSNETIGGMIRKNRLNMKKILLQTFHRSKEEKSAKALADQMEVLIGAIYLDSGSNLSVVKEWLETLGYFDLSKEELESLLLSSQEKSDEVESVPIENK